MKTKKFFIPLAAMFVVLIMVLVACGSKPAPSTTGASGNFPAGGTPGARNLTQPLPLAEQLVIGTLKLQGTSNALTPAQASALVPLWQAYAQLTSSNTAAQAEIDAVTAQIKQTLTAQQNQAITDMKLTRQDMFTEETSLGLFNGSGASGTPGFSATPGAGGNGGRFFAGGGGDGGGRFAGGGGGGFPGGGGFSGGAGGTGGTGGTRPTPDATQQALARPVRQPHPFESAERVGYLSAEDRRCLEICLNQVIGSCLQFAAPYKWDCPFPGRLIFWLVHHGKTSRCMETFYFEKCSKI